VYAEVLTPGRQRKKKNKASPTSVLASLVSLVLRSVHVCVLAPATAPSSVISDPGSAGSANNHEQTPRCLHSTSSTAISTPRQSPVESTRTTSAHGHVRSRPSKMRPVWQPTHERWHILKPCRTTRAQSESRYVDYISKDRYVYGKSKRSTPSSAYSTG